MGRTQPETGLIPLDRALTPRGLAAAILVTGCPTADLTGKYPWGVIACDPEAVPDLHALGDAVRAIPPNRLPAAPQPPVIAGQLGLFDGP